MSPAAKPVPPTTSKGLLLMPITQDRLYALARAAEEIILLYDSTKGLITTLRHEALAGNKTHEEAWNDLVAMVTSFPDRNPRLVISKELIHYNLTHRRNEAEKRRIARRRAREGLPAISHRPPLSRITPIPEPMTTAEISQRVREIDPEGPGFDLPAPSPQAPSPVAVPSPQAPPPLPLIPQRLPSAPPTLDRPIIPPFTPRLTPDQIAAIEREAAADWARDNSPSPFERQSAASSPPVHQHPDTNSTPTKD